MSQSSVPSYCLDDASLGLPQGLLLKFGLYLDLRRNTLLQVYKVPIIEEIVKQSFEILWELYWKQPDVLDKMISSLMMPLPEDQQYEQTYRNLAFQEPEIQNVIKIFYVNNPSRADSLAWDLILLKQLSMDIQRLSNFDYSFATNGTTEFLAQYNSHEGSSPDVETFKQRRYHSPSWKSFGEHVQHLFVKFQSDIDSGIDGFLKDHGHIIFTPPNPPINSTISNRLRERCVTSVVLFAPSGAGKTFEILCLLSQKFGFYFQGCQLPLSTGDTGIHGPHRQSGSKDTFSLSKSIDFVKKYIKVHDEISNAFVSLIITNWFRILLECRFFIFSRFLKRAQLWLSKHEESPLDLEGQLPRLWLLLQITDERDIFNPLFQISSLIYVYNPKDINSKLDPASVHVTIKEQGFSQPLYYCLDEAQADIDSYLFDGTEPWSLLSVWSLEFMSLAEGRNMRGSDISIFSGTSLKLKEATFAIKDLKYYPLVNELVDERLHKPRNWEVDEVYCLHLVTTVSDFRAMMAYTELAATLSQQYSHVEENITAKIIKCATVFFGRPRWSDIYLRSLNEHFNGPGITDWETSIDEIAEITRQNIKKDLYVRLETLNARESDIRYYNLVRNLCRVAVSQGLLDSGYFFINDEYYTLISEGFAYMAPLNGNYKQVIIESLAVQAVKEYFLSLNLALVEDQLKQMIQDQQNDRSALGKTAEWFLAWNLHRAFKDNQDRLIGSIDAERSTKILSSLSKEANPLDAKDPALDLTGYRVIEGANIGHMYNHKSAIKLSKWIESVRSLQRPVATYYFPDEQAGPDIIFALQPPENSTATIVLCLLQLKTTRDFNEKEDNKTTDLDKAYRKKKTGEMLPGYESVKKELDEELFQCSQHKIRILRVFFTASTRVGSPKRPSQGTSCHEYYVRIGQEQTELFFGQEFDFLLNYWRKNKDFPQSSLQIYKDLQELCDRPLQRVTSHTTGSKRKRS